MNSYFSDCKTFQEFKARFRDLAKRFHPDHGGNAEDFKAMSNEYQAKLNYFMRIDTRVEEILKYGTSNYNKASSIEDEYELAKRVDKCVNILGLTINISGSWLWIKREAISRIIGDDPMRHFRIKTGLLALGFTFSKKYDAYHWTAHYGEYRENEYTLNDLFSIFGNIQQSPEELG